MTLLALGGDGGKPSQVDQLLLIARDHFAQSQSVCDVTLETRNRLGCSRRRHEEQAVSRAAAQARAPIRLKREDLGRAIAAVGALVITKTWRVKPGWRARAAMEEPTTARSVHFSETDEQERCAHSRHRDGPCSGSQLSSTGSRDDTTKRPAGGTLGDKALIKAIAALCDHRNPVISTLDTDGTRAPDGPTEMRPVEPPGEMQEPGKPRLCQPPTRQIAEGDPFLRVLTTGYTSARPSQLIKRPLRHIEHRSDAP